MKYPKKMDENYGRRPHGVSVRGTLGEMATLHATLPFIIVATSHASIPRDCHVTFAGKIRIAEIQFEENHLNEKPLQYTE